MQDLKELILLLTQHNIHPLKHLAGSEDSKLLALYEGIAKGKFHSDDEAAAELYKGKGAASSYRKLKSDLRERLLEHVFQINTELSHYSDYQKAYYDCHKQWVIVRFLTGQNANTVALTLANKLLRTSEKFDFILLCMDIASYLRIQYGLRESNDKRFREASQQFEHFRKVYDAECLAEELYTTLVVRTVNNRSAQAEVNELAKEYYERIQEPMQQYQTYKLQMYGYMIGLMYHTSLSDYHNALLYCEKAIAFFKERPYEARVPLQIFYYQHLVCNIQLRQFEEGKESARQCINLMQEGTFNWFKYRDCTSTCCCIPGATTRQPRCCGKRLSIRDLSFCRKMPWKSGGFTRHSCTTSAMPENWSNTPKASSSWPSSSATSGFLTRTRAG